MQNEDVTPELIAKLLKDRARRQELMAKMQEARMQLPAEQRSRNASLAAKKRWADVAALKAKNAETSVS